MKTKLLITLTTVFLFLMNFSGFSASINLGTAADYVLFSTNGSLKNTGISQLTGNVGSNNGSSTGFGNVNGVMHDQDGSSAQCAADLLIAYNQLNSAIPTFFPSSLLGNGVTLVSGIYSVSGASTLNRVLTLDGKNDPTSKFIFQLNGSFSTSAESKVRLINGARACNVFWKVEGLVSMAPGTFMRGTVIANNAAVIATTRDTIEGRLLSTAGAITTDGILAYTPVQYGAPLLTGPIAPDLKSAECFTLFTSDGPVKNTGISTIAGSIGTNVGSVTGFNPLLVTGILHPIPDGTTAQCSTDLLSAYNFLNTIPDDIELLYPAQFGRNLVLTPHTYIMKAAVTFTDSLYLNALGNPDAVFVIKINGALTTSTYSKVLLINGAQAKNVYWKIEGAVSINNYSVFCGTIICNNGALGAINAGVILNGKALLTTGALTTASITTIMPAVCTVTGIATVDNGNNNPVLTFAPNPFKDYTTISLNDASKNIAYDLNVYNELGRVVINSKIIDSVTTLKTNMLHTGIYFYQVSDNGKLIQSGKLISQN